MTASPDDPAVPWASAATLRLDETAVATERRAMECSVSQIHPLSPAAADAVDLPPRRRRPARVRSGAGAAVKTDYFVDMYDTAADPWGFTSRWYEQRKYALTMAMLPHPELGRVAEPGCSLGMLTQALARRADHVVAGDLVPAAVDLARERVLDAGLGDRVTIGHWDLRDPWPDGPFDLVVLSEVVYYLEPDEARDLLDRAVAELAPGGHLVAAHWRPVVPEYPMTGDRAQAIVRATSGLTPMASYLDDDLTLDLFVHGGAESVAAVEGLR